MPVVFEDLRGAYLWFSNFREDEMYKKSRVGSSSDSMSAAGFGARRDHDCFSTLPAAYITHRICHHISSSQHPSLRPPTRFAASVGLGRAIR